MPYPIRTQPTSNFSISREKHLESISERSYGNRDYSGGRGYGDRYGADHGARDHSTGNGGPYGSRNGTANAADRGFRKEKYTPSQLRYSLGGNHDQFEIKRIITEKGALCNGDQNYIIKDHTGWHILNATEESSCLCVHCCGPSRAFALKIQDKRDDIPLVVFRRGATFNGMCCFLCMDCTKIKVNTVRGEDDEVEIGIIRKLWNPCLDSYAIEETVDEDDESADEKEKPEPFFIYVPANACRCFKNLTLKVVSKDHREIATISKQYMPPADDQETNEDHETFSLKYHVPLSIQMKTLLFAAAFVMIHQHFEMS